MSSFPNTDPRASEMLGHRERMAELRQIRERVDYIAMATPVFMSEADMACQRASIEISRAIAHYERGIEAAYQAGAPQEERLSDDERICPQCFDYVENCRCGRKGKA